MVNLICGNKGTSKTSRIIEKANADINTAKGLSFFISDTDRYLYDINRNIKVVNVQDFEINDDVKLLAFIGGVVASNLDITNIYIDGVSRIAGKEADDMQDFYDKLGILADKYSLSITVTVRAEISDLPDFLSEYKII